MLSVAHYRHNMIDGQLEPNQVLSPLILSAMGTTPREAFVPPAYAQAAYIDEPIPLIKGRYLLPPLLIGQLLKAADIQTGSKALVLNDGSGYCAALLSQMGCTTFLLEESQELANRARLSLSHNGFGKVEVHAGALDMALGATKPYHHIIVLGALQHVPECWLAQLEDGGNLTYIAARSDVPASDMVRGRITTLTKCVSETNESLHEDVCAPAITSLMPKGGFHFD